MFKKARIILLSLISLGALASTPVESLVPIENVFSPFGFDSNDSSEIIIEGKLPNLCHKSPMKEFKIVGNRIEIKVSALNYHESNPYCPQVEVPFLEVVNVGVLDKGIYDVVVNGKSIHEKRSKIQVHESSSDAIDEFAYANVEYIEKNSKNRMVKLKGHNPSDCFVFDEVQVLNNKKDVYSILPKMKQISDFCPMKMVEFEYEVEVPQVLKKEKVLLHVRIMNGKSVNSVFKNKK